MEYLIMENISLYFFWDWKFTLQGAIGEIGLTTFLEERMKGYLSKTLWIVNGISNNGRYFFFISFWNLLSRQISKINSNNHLVPNIF